LYLFKGFKHNLIYIGLVLVPSISFRNPFVTIFTTPQYVFYSYQTLHSTHTLFSVRV
jgi:hypothetical protein